MKKSLSIFNYSIQNALSDSVDIFIDGDIVDASTQSMLEAWWGDDTSVSYRSFRNQINSLTGANTFNVHINSYGGHVGDALAMYDFLVDLQNKGKVVNTIVTGIAASAATLIALAGKNPQMSKNSWFMVHTVSGGIWGNVAQVENYAVTMRKFNNKIVDLYVAVSGQTSEEVDKLMVAETWLTAEEAKEKGFISSITGEVSFTNKISKDNWEFANTAVLNSYNKSVKPEIQNQPDMNFFEKMKTDIVNAIKGITPSEGKADNTELLNSIGTVLTAQFSGMDEALTEQINTAVTAQTSEVVTNAVAEAIKPFQNQLTTLQTQNETLIQQNKELEQDIVNFKGKDSKSEKVDEIKPIGGF